MITHYLTKYRSITLLIVVLTFMCLILSVRGLPGNPNETDLLTKEWQEDGPFELSPERGRFALLYSLVENHSFQFSLPIARFAAPDVAFSNGEFVSMFAPGVSIMVVPGYLLGKFVGFSQVGTFLVISIFAFINLLLIKAISQKLGASSTAALIAGIIFLFASPAYAYAVTLYQHHLSTFLILISLYTLLRFNNLKSLLLIWIACGLSIMVDNPNAFFMLPIGLFALTRLIKVNKTTKHITLQLKLLGVLGLFVVLIPLGIFMSINYYSYGDPLQLAGTVTSAKGIFDQLGGDISNLSAVELVIQNTQEENRSAVNFFTSRNLLNGFYTHFLSLDRGMIVYTPILLLGFVGLLHLRKTHSKFFALLVSVLGMIVLLYSLWGDPYGGWAFGSRYLIPAYAILSVGLSLLLTRFRKNLLVLLCTLILSGYSIVVNTAGALTSNTNPPQVEILALEQVTGKPEPYTFKRNFARLSANQSKSAFFQVTGQHFLTAWQFALVIMLVISLSVIVLYAQLLTEPTNNSKGKYHAR